VVTELALGRRGPMIGLPDHAPALAG